MAYYRREIDASGVNRAVENFKVHVEEIRERADEIGNQENKYACRDEGGL